ncbi:MAG: NAD(P)/FAD-dependent oxidoreductase [Myxococcaceae bacterium]
MIPRVVIVGGGFGGLYAAQRFSRGNVKVTLIDRQNYHLFQPLLYQVATAGLSPGDIATPIRSIVAGLSNVEVRMGDVTRVDLKARQVLMGDGSALDYDFVILATGVRHSYFGKDQWEPLAPGLKTLDDALEMRRRVLTAFEDAEKEEDEAKRAAILTFVIVGGGPTGVELAGAIAELARFTVARDYRRFDPRKTRVVLVEAGDRVLGSFDPKLSAHALETLTRLGVDVRLERRVTDIDREGCNVSPAAKPPEGQSAPPPERIAARTVLWAAGVAASPLGRTLGVELDRAGRIKVQSDLSIPGFPTAYVVGDLACFTLPDGTTLPGLAPPAMQQGAHAADNILAASVGHSTAPFEYFDKGTMATIGRASGIAQSGRLKLSGFLGWCAWLFIHILYLIGFRNRLAVMLQWAWAWFTFGRSARLITGSARAALPAGPARP